MIELLYEVVQIFRVVHTTCTQVYGVDLPILHKNKLDYLSL